VRAAANARAGRHEQSCLAPRRKRSHSGETMSAGPPASSGWLLMTRSTAARRSATRRMSRKLRAGPGPEQLSWHRRISTRRPRLLDRLGIDPRSAAGRNRQPRLESGRWRVTRRLGAFRASAGTAPGRPGPRFAGPPAPHTPVRRRHVRSRRSWRPVLGSSARSGHGSTARRTWDTGPRRGVRRARDDATMPTEHLPIPATQRDRTRQIIDITDAACPRAPRRRVRAAGERTRRAARTQAPITADAR
jgi:hypothetical protein